MYQLSVPVVISHSHFDREQTLSELKRMGADRVFLTLYRDLNARFSSDGELERLRGLLAYFREAGLEAGVWLGETLGHGWGKEADLPYTRMVTMDGVKLADCYCPLDPQFTEDLCGWVEKVAAAGTKLILLDDDFRMVRGGINCFCERHLAEYRRRTGEDLSPEEIRSRVYCGGPNPWRDQWLAMMGSTLEGLAQKIRGAADRVDKQIRIGLCAAPSSWDVDGTDVIRLSKILSGPNRPLLRLLGAPYCASFGDRLTNMIEVERLEASWCKKEDIELISEGDTYPRPRHVTPAAYLEGFDTALRADGSFDGILKYVLDYNASPRYETGYADRHIKNRALYAKLEEDFAGRPACGINIVDPAHIIKDADLPLEYTDYKYITERFFPASIRMAYDNSLPTAFGGDGPSLIFGEAAKHIRPELLSQGAFLDLPAAKFLQERGVDVGISSFGTPMEAYEEFYHDENEHISLFGANNISLFRNCEVCRLEHKKGASVLTSFTSFSGDETVPGVFTYENSGGCRFLVFPFDAFDCKATGGLFRCYCRQRQLIQAAEWLNRKPLDAVCPGHPDLYIQCKKDASGLAVGLWNFFADSIEQPEVILSKNYRSIRFLQGGGTLEAGRVRLDSIAPFGFTGFVLS